ncbi:MAG: hypothetical protein NC131_06355 [Roseburia sp.]|nr:hypothetical protein [Roseburia sp.]
MKISNDFKSKLKTYFIKRLGAYEYRHGWMKLPVCPYCGRENKMGINLSTYRTNCFRCGEHPRPSQLVMDVENIDVWSDLLRFLDSADFTTYTFKEEKVELLEKKPVYLPEGFQNIKYGTSQLANTMRGYVKKRGFDVQELSRMGIGYCNDGPLFGYLIIPFYYRGELRYYNARLVIGNGPRYNNPNKDTTGLGKEFIIYNYDALFMYKSVYLCEGAINAMTMGERGIATMGKAISAYQVNEIIKSPVERIIILLDPDAKEQAINLALKLVHYKSVKVVFLPEGKDCNDLGRKKVFKYIYSTHYQDYNDLMQLKNSL